MYSLSLQKSETTVVFTPDVVGGAISSESTLLFYHKYPQMGIRLSVHNIGKT